MLIEGYEAAADPLKEQEKNKDHQIFAINMLLLPSRPPSRDPFFLNEIISYKESFPLKMEACKAWIPARRPG